MRTIGHWIGGKSLAGESGRTAPVYDPALGTQTASVSLASADEVDHAVAVASAAAQEWAGSSLSVRAGILFRFRELIDENRSELAALVTAEHGKVLNDAAGEVARG